MPAHYDISELRTTERNALLRDLGGVDYDWLAEHLEEVTIRPGEVLVPANSRATHAYFPQTGVVSQIATFSGGASVEVGTIGWEGVVGIPFVLRTETSPHQCLVQIEAVIRRVPAEVFEEALERSSVDQTMRRYVDAYLVQVSQIAACNRMHDLASRAARWLLMTHDRVGVETFALTHEFLAMMLGVRRAGVSEAAAELQRRGAIRYSRGRVTVLDRSVLESAACECYGVIRARFDSMLQRSTAEAGSSW